MLLFDDRGQWYRILPLPPSVCGLDYMNFFCLNPRNFQLAYRGMPLNSRTGKKGSMCWRSKRDDPLDSTGLILSRRRYGFRFSQSTWEFLCVCRLFRISLSLSSVQSISQTIFLPLEQSHYSTGYSSLSTINTLPSTRYHTTQPRFCSSYFRHRAVSSLALQRIETTALLAVMVSN
jgi:hypothetical protein